MNFESYPSNAPVIELDANTRGRFIARTYAHLMGAFAAFTVIEIFLFKSGLAESIARALLGTSWLLVLGGFMILSWIASYAANNARSLAAQYAALAAYVVGEAVIFVPLLYIADHVAPGTIGSAVLVTLLAFVSLTLLAFSTRKDFSFLRSILLWSGIVAIVAIIGGVVFGFHLGTFFSVAMIAVAGGAILYDTSNVLHHYPENRYVAASLQLFASVALMLWYVLRLLLDRR